MNVLGQNSSLLAEVKLELEQVSSLLSKMRQEPLTKEEYTRLQFLLLKQECLYRSNDSFADPYPVCKTMITGDKIMFISDTHFGNPIYGNRELVWTAYNKALQMNIKTVVHAGDLIEACAYYHNKKYEDVFKELEIALYDMPNDLTTKLLLGNHDYSAIRTYPEIKKYFFESPKLDILGMGKILLNWDRQADIYINHPISQLKSAENREYEGIITIEGHHHFYQFMEQGRKIYLPSLSSMAFKDFSLPLSGGQFSFRPVFLIASKQGESSLLFEIYCIEQEQKGTILSSETIEINTKTKRLTLYK